MAQHNTSLEELENFHLVLEQDRLELVEAGVNHAAEKGCNQADLAKLATEGAGIQSVKDAIAFRKSLGG